MSKQNKGNGNKSGNNASKGNANAQEIKYIDNIDLGKIGNIVREGAESTKGVKTSTRPKK